jgi:hypothetical protein
VSSMRIDNSIEYLRSNIAQTSLALFCGEFNLHLPIRIEIPGVVRSRVRGRDGEFVRIFLKFEDGHLETRYLRFNAAGYNEPGEDIIAINWLRNGGVR